MTKRKSTRSRKPDARTTGVAKPALTLKRAVPAPALTGSKAEDLLSAPDTETRLPDLPGQEIDNKLPPVPPPDLESRPAPAPQLAEPKLDVVLPVEVRAQAKDAVHADTGDARTACPSPTLAGSMNGAWGAITSIEACRNLFMEMTQDNLDFAAGLVAMRSPLDILDVATRFTGRQMAIYDRFSRTVADIAGGRRAP
jgi:hypothetical protein